MADTNLVNTDSTVTACIFRLLSNEQADALAEEFANKVDARLAVLIDEELDRIEARKAAA